MKTKWFILGLLLIGGVGTVMWLFHQKPSPQVVVTQPRQATPAPVIKLPPTAQESLQSDTTKSPQTHPAPKPPVQAQVPVQNVRPPKEPLQDPVARDALALVGMDPEAEQYWLDAIFDTGLPDKEREDLMEDLNETGFADPKNLTTDDLLLIVNRLRLIDAVLPNADDFMVDHLREAQKDLVNMYARLVP